MATESAVDTEARKLLLEKDEDALEVLIGLRQKAIDENPGLAAKPDLYPKYDSTDMGALDTLKGLGHRVANRWNKELYRIVCENKGSANKEREDLLNALNLGDAAIVGVVASILIGLSVPPPIAAAVAALIVKKFISPAKDELCAAWGEAMAAG
jgi:hypothetical protein